MSIKKLLLALIAYLITTNAFSSLNKSLITIHTDIYKQFFLNNIHYEVIYSADDLLVIEVPSNDLEKISKLSHDIYHRCGGFILEENALDAYFSISDMSTINKIQIDNINFDTIKNSNTIKELIKKINPSRIKSDIQSLSSFRNRYYKSIHGQNSQQWLMDHWKEIAKQQSHIKIERFSHSQFAQPSIIATIEGSDAEDEYIIVGGHGDSISGWYPSNDVLAPGADDNASGIATLTEVFRVLSSFSQRPSRTIQFISYAAEEVGLRGSNEIAKKYKEDQKDIKGVIQLDMTNHRGSDNDIVFISDYTNSAHTQYLVRILDTYLPRIKWSLDKCGYACSDHVSWYRQGFPVSFPFESTFNTYNKKIHTTHDTLETLKNNADHASNFAKLTLAYILETAFSSLD